MRFMNLELPESELVEKFYDEPGRPDLEISIEFVTPQEQTRPPDYLNQEWDEKYSVREKDSPQEKAQEDLSKLWSDRIP